MQWSEREECYKFFGRILWWCICSTQLRLSGVHHLPLCSMWCLASWQALFVGGQTFCTFSSIVSRKKPLLRYDCRTCFITLPAIASGQLLVGKYLWCAECYVAWHSCKEWQFVHKHDVSCPGDLTILLYNCDRNIKGLVLHWYWPIMVYGRSSFQWSHIWSKYMHSAIMSSLVAYRKLLALSWCITVSFG